MNKRMVLAGSVRVFARYKLRSFLMGLGVVIGVAALIVMRSIGTSAEDDVLDNFNRLFSGSAMTIMNRAMRIDGEGQWAGKLTIEDLEALSAELPQVVDFDPGKTATREVSYRDVNRSLMIRGAGEHADVVMGRGVMRGEFFRGSEIRSAARVALIGLKVAESLFEDEDPIGKQIEIGGSPFRIKGVLEEHGFDPHGMDLDDQVHVPITTMMRRIVNAQHIDSARLLLAEGTDLEAAVDDVTDVLRARHELGATVQDDFSIYTPNQVQRLVKEANQVVTVYLPATAVIALLVAAMVIANIMLMSVKERTPEIGLRKAVGATEGQIKGQFFAESLVTSLFSGLIGAGLGIAIVAVLGMHNTTITIAPDAVLFGLLTALVVGTLAGYLPARRAARLEAVEALK